VTTCAFVTGGSGFIGGALVRRLVADGWTVRALARSDTSADAVRERGAEPVRGETQGVTPTGRSVPAPVANAVATVGETAWRMLSLPGRPPLTRLAVWLSALETTIDITRARTELGYAPVRTIDEGLEELSKP
jgi:nucleoside-diphosphate-sugar epimerase